MGGLHQACKRGDGETTRRLVECERADPNGATISRVLVVRQIMHHSEGRTVLWVCGCVCVCVLELYFSGVDEHDATPLYYAAFAGHAELVTYLLERGARCDSHTFQGERCFYGALNPSIRKMLVDHSSDFTRAVRHPFVKFLERLEKTTALHDFAFHFPDGAEYSAARVVLCARCARLASAFVARAARVEEREENKQSASRSPALSLLCFVLLVRFPSRAITKQKANDTQAPGGRWCGKARVRLVGVESEGFIAVLRYLATGRFECARRSLAAARSVARTLRLEWFLDQEAHAPQKACVLSLPLSRGILPVVRGALSKRTDPHC